MRIVLDTNVLLAGTATHGLCEPVVAIVLRDHTLVLSDYILLEFERNYVDKFKATTAQAHAAVDNFRKHCDLVEPASVPIDACSDPDDAPILGTAEAYKTDYLVTGDQGLLQLGSYKGIPIVSPRAFYELVRDRT